MAASQHTSITNPDFMAQIGQLLHQQSTLLAFVHTFGFILVSYIVLLPLVLLFKAKMKNASSAAPH
ncbi:hypothetical protein [Shewanella marina]|uniref:hypothetical protein n=1 Tax=Shewanella marina TaxID=487319 RepID=UPI000AAD325C|nr:hypothetical protein [Shewanella marina]